MKPLLVASGALAGVALVPVLLLTGLSGPPQVPPVSLGDNQSVSCTVKAPEASGDTLTAQQVAAHAHAAGFRGLDLRIAVAVAKAESGWRPRATLVNTNDSVDHGLFQINSVHATILASGNWADPGDNAKMAYQVWKDAGGKWSPWVTYWRGTYRQFLDDVDVKQDCAPEPIVGKCGKKVAKGYPNGRIPSSALCTLWASPNHKLRADAADRFDTLAKAYSERFGHKPCITDSYRSLAAQIDVRRRKPGLAAVPGTSNHGWGMALDLCGPGGGPWVNGAAYDVWMQQNGPKYGWKRPSWADPGGGKPEPWHHECFACGAE